MKADFKAWLEDACIKHGEVVLSKHELETIFNGKQKQSLNELKEFCASKKIDLTVDTANAKFIFTLHEEDERGFR